MDFDVQAFYEDELGQDEERFEAFRDALDERFYTSPEWVECSAAEGEEEGYWAGHFVHYSTLYLAVPLAKVDADDVDEILFDVFPRKISLTAPEETEEALDELIAFWHFLKREFGLENADTVLQALHSVDLQEFTEAMFDPANFGMAKSFFMEGMQAGYDMTNQDEMNAFMKVYNARVLAEGPRPVGQSSHDLLPSIGFPSAADPFAPSHSITDDASKKKKKNKRKLAKASRKKNRKGKK